MRRLATYVWLLFILLWAPQAAYPDTLYLTDGRIIKGLVIEDYEDRILFKTYEEEQLFLRNEIDEVFYDEPTGNFLHLGRQALAMRDVARGQSFFEQALKLRPSFVRALEGRARAYDLKEKEKYAEPATQLKLREQLGIRIARVDDDIIIMKVYPDSTLKEAGAHEGDHLVRVFDLACRYRQIDSVIRELVGTQASTVRVTIGREVSYLGKPNSFWERLLRRLKRRFIFEMRYEGLTVSGFDPSGNFQEGDRVTAISGRPTRYMPVEDANKLLSQPEALNLKIERTLQVIRR